METNRITVAMGITSAYYLLCDGGTNPNHADTLLRDMSTGKRRMAAVGPLGSGKLVYESGAYVWQVNPDTVHASLKGSLDFHLSRA